MQVTKELIENDIRAMEAQLENAKAQLNQIVGSLATLKGVKEFLEKEEPKPAEASTEISEENAKVQAEVEAAMALNDTAEVEEPEVLPAAAEIWEAPTKAKAKVVVDGNGKYI